MTVRMTYNARVTALRQAASPDDQSVSTIICLVKITDLTDTNDRTKNVCNTILLLNVAIPFQPAFELLELRISFSEIQHYYNFLAHINHRPDAN
jgi:hypothetical protein